MAQPKVDISRFNAKIAAIIQNHPAACKKAVDYGSDEIFKGAEANLTGPRYGMTKTKSGGQKPNYPEGGGQRGQMPIPIITGTLRRSLQRVRPSDYLAVVFANKEQAIYARAVHEGITGTRRRPRRFLGDVVRLKRDSIKKEMTRIIKEDIQKHGRA